VCSSDLRPPAWPALGVSTRRLRRRRPTRHEVGPLRCATAVAPGGAYCPACRVRRAFEGSCGFFSLDDTVAVSSLPAEGSCEAQDRDLLRGAVPRLPDWLRAWRALRSPQSFRSAEEQLSTEHYIRAIREKPVGRKALANMIRVMAEVVRDQKRAWVRNAFSITLLVDDKGPFRLVRFKTDAGETAGQPVVGGGAGVVAETARPGAAGEIARPATQIGGTASECWGKSSSAGAHSGVLTIFNTGDSMTPEDFDEDYAQRMCDSITRAIRHFCTPWQADTCDEALRRHFLASVRVFMGDGGVQKCGALLQRVCPNLIAVARDPTHYIRIACRDPLHTEARFGEQWARLFGARHALIADIKNSDQWRARLQACQRRVLAVDGCQGGGLTSVLKHMSFAKQRFESFVGPRRKYICLLQAIVMLLCGLAGDPRQDRGTRDRAEQSLDAITPADILTCGLAADFAECCLSFIRAFDVGDHDCASSAAQLREFRGQDRRVVLEGFHFRRPAGQQRGCCWRARGRVGC